MALVPVTVSGILKSANGTLLTGKTIEYTALGVYGDAGVLVPPVKVTTVTHATTAAFSSVLLTSDAADAFVRFQVKFHTGSKKKFDLTDGDLTADLDDLINIYDGSAIISDAAALAAVLAAQAVPRILASVVIATNIGTKQALWTVPAGKKGVITQVVVRSASINLVAIGAGLTVGFNAAADNVLMFSPAAAWLQLLTSSLHFIAKNPTAALVGNSAEVLGGVFLETDTTATVTVDVIGYTF